MHAFPLQVLRSLSLLMHKTESSDQARTSRIQKIVKLFNLLNGNHLQPPREWNEVMHLAEVRGALLHELDLLICAALRQEGFRAEQIRTYQQQLLVASSSDKLAALLQNVTEEFQEAV